MKYFYLIVFSILVIEFFLFKSSKKIRKQFPWLISNEDLYPVFKENEFLFFKKFRFDYNLGWQNKPGYKNFDKIKKRKINYTISKRGFRTKRKNNKKELFASFGDSYVFCRQVGNNETWQEQLAKNKSFCILNYGEGNFGLDQGILKYLNTKLKKDTKFVIQGFVPETISRIQSEWKHFMEFGNLHGFKPRFKLVNGKLILKKNPINKNTKIENLSKVIDKIKQSDRFYKEKFSKHTLQFPYILNFLKNFVFNSKIFLNFYLINFKLFFFKNKINLKDELFEIVVKNNLKISHNLYNEESSQNLFLKLIEKFKIIAKKRNHVPILIIFPQLLDLKLEKTANYFKNFYNNLNKKIYVINLTDKLYNYDFKKLYVNDRYGGHFSKYGNKIAGKIISKELDKIL